MMDFEVLRGEHMKKNSTLPTLRVKLLENGDPFNLNGYSIDMKMKRTDADSLKIDTSAAVDNANRGIVTYDWSSSDTDTTGTFLVEFVADDGTDTVTFPNNGFGRLYIEEGL